MTNHRTPTRSPSSSPGWTQARWPWIVATIVLFIIAVASCGGNSPTTAAPATPPPPVTSTVYVPAPPVPSVAGPYTGGTLDADNDGTPDSEENNRSSPRRTGSSSSDDDNQSGNACLPGQRDGDGDGRCNE